MRPALAALLPLGCIAFAPAPRVAPRHRQVSTPCCLTRIRMSSANDPAPQLGTAYATAKAATALSWTACAACALSTHPVLRLPVRHNILTIGQALTPLPLMWAVLGALQAAAAKAGMTRLQSSTYRRLNLGMAAASSWAAAAAALAPRFAVEYDMYPLPLKTAAAVTHAAVAVLCIVVWGRSVSASPAPVAGHYVPRIVRGITGSLACLGPNGASDDPDAEVSRDGRSEYAISCAGFLWFAVMPIVCSFPLATVPTILGKRLSRAASAWTFLAAVVTYTLKDAAERGRLHASTFVTLRNGLAAFSATHLALIALKLCGGDGGFGGLRQFYPAALSRPKTALASLLPYALALFAAMTPPAKPEGEEEAPGN